MPKGRTQQPRTAANAASRGIQHRDNIQHRDTRSLVDYRDLQETPVSPDYSPPSTVDCAVNGTAAFTLYIGYVHSHIPSKMIFSVFRKLGLGKLIKGDDAIEMIHRAGRDGKRDYQAVKINFEHPFLRGPDGQKNVDMLNHIATVSDGVTVSSKESFQLEYQAARTNQRTGRDEPSRYWQIRYWSDESPTGAKSGAKSGTKSGTKSRPAVTLIHKATRRNTTPSEDGWIKPKITNPMPKTPEVLRSNRGPAASGGQFSALDVNHDDIEVAEVLAAIDMIHTSSLTKTPEFNQDGTIAPANAIDADIQAEAELFAAEELLANEGVGNIPGSSVDPCDFLNVSMNHPYDQYNGSTTVVDPDTGAAVAIEH